MAKDPAFLFYSSDFLTGTFTMSDEQVGKYIRLLCLQHQKGTLTLKDIEYICKGNDPEIFSKFEMDGNGNYFNKILNEKVELRKKHSERQKENIKKRYQSDTTHLPNQEKLDTKELPLEIEDVIESEVVTVIKILNEITGSQFKPNSKSSQKHIHARLNEGYTIEEFRNVISAKFFEWGNDSKMNSYLRPETLFGTKFESYLQATKKIITENGTGTGQKNYNGNKADVAQMVRQTRDLLGAGEMYNDRGSN